jgi:hypothetical protein
MTVATVRKRSDDDTLSVGGTTQKVQLQGTRFAGGNRGTYMVTNLAKSHPQQSRRLLRGQLAPEPPTKSAGMLQYKVSFHIDQSLGARAW